MKIFLTLSILFTLTLNLTYAQTKTKISAVGSGPTEQSAREDALSALSMSLSSEVKVISESRENFSEIQNVSNKKASTTLTKNRFLDRKLFVSSELPLYGIDFETKNNGLRGTDKEYSTTAILDFKKALPAYQKEIQNIVNKINASFDTIGKLSVEAAETAWQILSSDYATLSRLQIVADVIGLKNTATPQISATDFQIQYERRSKQANTLELAAEMLLKGMNLSNVQNIYVMPALLESDNTATEFSKTLATNIKAKLNRKISISKSVASYFLQGTYYFVPGETVDGEDVIVSYYLCKNDGSVLASSLAVRIPYKVHNFYKSVPKGYDLARQIENGNVSTGDFDVSIRINGERKALEYRKGDSLEIEVRATEPCYIYVIGYVYNDEEEPFSYLFPLMPYATGKEMFVRRINPSEANKWIVINPKIGDSIANIEIIPPYGEETLHVFAMTESNFEKIVEKIPHYIETDDFYLVSGNPTNVVSMTRALAIKKASSTAAKVVKTAESSVSYLTHE